MRILGRLSAFCVVVLLLLAPATADLRFSANVLWDPSPDDDTQIFLHVANEAYPVPRERAVAVFPRLEDPHRDYPILAFIAHHGHADIEAVWSYRTGGRGWFDVMVHFGVPPRLLFVELPEPPGPPYGKAYGHWKKRGNGLGSAHVTDADVLFWVNLRAASGYAGISPAKLLAEGKSVKDFQKVTAARFRAKVNKHVKAQRANLDHPKEEGHGKGKRP